MGIIPFGGIKITRSNNRISIKVVGSAEDVSAGELYLSRVGEKFEFAVYAPVRISANYLEFIFDSLLLDKAFGRYKARLVVGGVDRSVFYLQYVDEEKVEIRNV